MVRTAVCLGLCICLCNVCLQYFSVSFWRQSPSRYKHTVRIPITVMELTNEKSGGLKVYHAKKCLAWSYSRWDFQTNQFRPHPVRGLHTPKEGPVRIQHTCLVPIYVFPEIKLLVPNRIIMFCLWVPTLIYLWEIYIFPGSVCLFCCREICGPILGIYESLTDTWLWKLGLRLHNSPKRNT